MSYEIVKSIKIDKTKKEVWIRSACSNVTPKTFELWLCKSLTELFQKEGLEALEKEILLQYWKGEFQKTNNNYEKSLILLDTTEYNWDTVGHTWKSNPNGGDPICVKLKYSDEDVKEVLYKNFLDYKNRKKGKFVIQNKETKNYIYKFYSRGCYLTRVLASAKVFSSREDALYSIQNFSANKYEILEVAK